jgi:hypothetical protein
MSHLHTATTAATTITSDDTTAGTPPLHGGLFQHVTVSTSTNAYHHLSCMLVDYRNHHTHLTGENVHVRVSQSVLASVAI